MKKLVMLGVVGLVVAGCGDTKLVGTSLPDETRVVDGPSLALPPSFELRPPRQAQDYESVLRAQKGVEAQVLITGVSGTVAAASSSVVPAGDRWLVQQTGVKVDPNVREALEQKPVEEVKKKSMWQRWFGKDEAGE